MTDKKKETLETVGSILGEDAKRDAIHIAVAPVEAQETLWPGENVGADGSTSSELVGIVDPFLKKHVKKGERFWLFIYPKKIESLRHVWTHPAFADESAEDERKIERVIETLDGGSMKWIEEFAAKLSLSYEDLMDAAALYAGVGEYTNLGNNESYTDYYQEFPEFWEHYEKVTGISPKDEKSSFFSCSC